MKQISLKCLELKPLYYSDYCCEENAFPFFSFLSVCKNSREKVRVGNMSAGAFIFRLLNTQTQHFTGLPNDKEEGLQVDLQGSEINYHKNRPFTLTV